MIRSKEKHQQLCTLQHVSKSTSDTVELIGGYAVAVTNVESTHGVHRVNVVTNVYEFNSI